MDHKLKILMQNIYTRHLINPINLNNITDQLLDLQDTEVKYFFLLGDMNSIKMVLDTADKMNFLHRRYKWHVVTLSEESFQCDCSNVTILLAKPKNGSTKNFKNIKKSYKFEGESDLMAAFYYDLTILTVLTIRDMLIANKWPEGMQYLTCEQFDEDSNNLTRNDLDLKKYFNNTIMTKSTYLPFKMKQDGITQMDLNMDISVMTIQNKSLNDVSQIGSWESEFPFSLNLYENISHILGNYSYSKYYRIVTLEQKPYVYIDKSAPGGYRGYCIDLLNEIANIIDFKYEIRLISDNSFGSVDANGEWDGMVRELKDERADIGLAALRVTPDRKKVIDYTLPISKGVGFTIHMKRHVSSRSLFKFFSVLNAGVWVCLLVAYLFTSFIIWFFDRFSPYSYQNIKKHKKLKNRRLFTFSESVYFCIMSLTPQGSGEAPLNISGRLITATWWLFGFLIISSYTANLAAFLSFSSQDKLVNSIHDLPEQYQISYAPVYGSQAMRQFETLAEIEERFYNIWQDLHLDYDLPHKELTGLSVWDYPLSTKYSRMWQAMKQTGLPRTEEEAIQRVLNSKSETDGFAFIGESKKLKYFAMINCDLQVIGKEFAIKPLALAVQKNSPLTYHLNHAIMELMSERKLEMLDQKWWINNPEAASDCTEESIMIEGADIEDIGGILIVIFVAVIFVCLVVFFKNKIKPYGRKIKPDKLFNRNR